MAFKVFGYLPSYRYYLINDIEFSKLTHVCLSFINPDESGNFSYSKSISDVIEKAKPFGCKVFISIGGGGLTEEVENTYRVETEFDKRASFINKLMIFARAENVDGIDIDLEGSMVQMPTYDEFVQDLIDSAHASKIEVSAALARWSGIDIESSTLERLDFINIMSYDLTGPWTGPGQHAPMSQVENEFNYWHGRGLLKNNLIIGLPFYGYDFNDEETKALTWCEIVDKFPDSLMQDNIITQSGELFFNGKNTIKEKVEFVKKNEAGGVMIWEIGQDCFTDNSLLSFVNQEIMGVGELLEEININQKIVYPNPSFGVFNFTISNSDLKFRVFNLMGELISEGENLQKINLKSVPNGVYLLIVQNNRQRKVTRLVKN